MQACAEPRVLPLKLDEASILLIENDDDAGVAITDLLESQHYTVFRSFDAFEGLEQLRAGLSPDIIVLDLGMPCMSEWEFRALQQSEPMLSAIPIVALSADDCAKMPVIDAEAFLQKPVEGHVLLDALRKTFEEVARRRSDEQAAQQERLSALGVMAAGLAHEVNNPLSAMLGNLELASRRCTELLHELDGPRAQILTHAMRFMSEAQAGGTQIAEVVRGVSTFARPETDRVAPFDVQTVLESSIRLAANEIRHCAQLERSYSQVPRVCGNAAKLAQVFLNLLINAVHAIGDNHRSGAIHVSIAAREGDVVVSVADNGHGIAPAIAARIFDPFFSTKPRGRGMGLGLALSQRSVQAMGGGIRVESQLGHGSVFFVSLPACSPTLTTRAVPEASTGLVAALPRTRPRILVIDDEEMMCSMLAAILRDDYDVTTCVDPHAAMSDVVSGPPFDLVLCDLMMPSLSGMDLYGELRRKRPELAERMLFMTGGTFTERARLFLDDGAHPYIKKPFQMDEMLNLLRALVANFSTAHLEGRARSLRSN